MVIFRQVQFIAPCWPINPTGIVVTADAPVSCSAGRTPLCRHPHAARAPHRRTVRRVPVTQKSGRRLLLPAPACADRADKVDSHAEQIQVLFVPADERIVVADLAEIGAAALVCHPVVASPRTVRRAVPALSLLPNDTIW